MKTIEIQELLIRNFGFECTNDQFVFFEKFSKFIHPQSSDFIFILRGYAGTGKTTLVKTLNKSLPQIKKNLVLLAPTGRAAKVLAKSAGLYASTIHRRIYAQESTDGRVFSFSRAVNKSKNTLFVIDEASMISGQLQLDGNMFAGSNLLSDLLEYVEAGENCQILFIGDVAQLPPVKERVSPSLSPQMLRSHFGELAQMVELAEVLRQKHDSGILMNATLQRQRLIDKIGSPMLQPTGSDVINLEAFDLEDTLQTAYSEGLEHTVVITRSNKAAIMYNQQIRNRILYREEEIEVGDLLMVVKNNYFWLDNKSKAGFVANGDIVEVLSIGAIEERWGFRFVKCDVQMMDYPTQKPFEVILNLNALYSEAPSLTQSEQDKLYLQVQAHYSDTRDKKLLFQRIKADPYFNALQVKFSYAITCHKSQGGQWQNVFVDQGYVTEETLGIEFMRWIYTAITRATDKLYLLNFNEDFISEQLE